MSYISQNRNYALQIDESTDIANVANLMALVKYEIDEEIYDDIYFPRRYEIMQQKEISLMV